MAPLKMLNATADWPRIEREALDQVRDDLATVDTAPMDYGQLVAWAECRFGRTDSLGLVHRVGAWDVERATTICGDVIPSAIRRLVLTPNLIRTLGRCRYCDTAYAQKGPQKGVAA